MARLMEVLQIERVIPHLLVSEAIKRCRADFELDDENDGTDEKDDINASAHTRDAEFEEDRTMQSRELRAQKCNLLQPRIALRKK